MRHIEKTKNELVPIDLAGKTGALLGHVDDLGISGCRGQV